VGAAPAIIALIGWGSCLASGWFAIPIFVAISQDTTERTSERGKYLHRGSTAVVRDMGTQKMLPQLTVINCPDDDLAKAEGYRGAN